jgi:hypothetical protein
LLKVYDFILIVVEKLNFWIMGMFCLFVLFWILGFSKDWILVGILCFFIRFDLGFEEFGNWIVCMWELGGGARGCGFCLIAEKV